MSEEEETQDSCSKSLAEHHQGKSLASGNVSGVPGFRQTLTAEKKKSQPNLST